jgi:endo-1,4-beta-D-glucanase Y
MLTTHAFKWAAITLAATTFLTACGGGGTGGAASGIKSDSAAVNSASPATATETAVVAPTATRQPSASAIPQSANMADLAPVNGLGYAFGSRRIGYVAGIQPKSSTLDAQDAAVKQQYDKWRAAGVESRCGGYVVRFNANYAEVSEGAGYGMLLSVVMAGHDGGAKDLFDGLFRVVRANPAYNTGYPALMNWRINADCSGAGDGWNAMDGDLDIAMALLMADKQWGSSSGVNYRAEALATIAAIKGFNMNGDGATKGLPSGANNRTSDYMIGHFKAFGRATGDGFWNLATDKAFALMNTMQSQFAPNTGLIPDFVINTASNPAPSNGYIGDGNEFEGFYWWNACRLPWRLASDYVTSGDARSQNVTGKMMDFFVRDTGGKLENIREGYRLDGSAVIAENLYWNPGSFVGPAMAGAMVDGRFQDALNGAWSYLAAKPSTAYYDSEIQLLSMIVATGNWWNP